MPPTGLQAVPATYHLPNPYGSKATGYKVSPNKDATWPRGHYLGLGSRDLVGLEHSPQRQDSSLRIEDSRTQEAATASKIQNLKSSSGSSPPAQSNCPGATMPVCPCGTVPPCQPKCTDQADPGEDPFSSFPHSTRSPDGGVRSPNGCPPSTEPKYLDPP